MSRLGNRVAAIVIGVVLLEGLIALIASSLASFRPYTFWDEFETGNLAFGLLIAAFGLGYLGMRLWLKEDR